MSDLTSPDRKCSSCKQIREQWQFRIASGARTFRKCNQCRFHRSGGVALNRVIHSLATMSQSWSSSASPAEYLEPEPEPENK